MKEIEFILGISLGLIFVFILVVVVGSSAIYYSWIQRSLIIDFFRPDRPNSIPELLLQAYKERKEQQKYKINPQKRKKVKEEPHGVILGKNERDGTVFYSPEMEEGNIFVSGFPGTGKTAGILIPTLLNFRGKVFCIDISGDISAVIKRPGQYNYRPEEGIGRYDVFFAVNHAESRAERLEQLALIAQLIMPTPKNTDSNNKFFRDNGRAMLNACLIYFYQKGYEFGEMCIEITKMSAEELLNMLLSVEEEYQDYILPLISCFIGANEKNTQGCKGDMDDAIKFFATNENVRKTLCSAEPGKKCIAPQMLEIFSMFIIIPQQKLETYQPLLRLITGQMLNHFTGRPLNAKGTILLALDEFGRFGNVAGIVDALGTLRKRKVRVLLMTQTIPDLDGVYGMADREAILGNCAFRVCLGAMDKTTQEYFSFAVGKHYKTRYGANMSSNNGDRYSLNEQREEIIEPAELAYIHSRNKLLVLTPQGYLRLEKFLWYKEPLCRRWIENNKARIINQKNKMQKKGIK